MEKKTIAIFISVMLLLAIALVSAIDFNPNGDIELRGLWKIKNATSITTQNITVSNTLSILGGITGLDNKTTLSCSNITGSLGALCSNQTASANSYTDGIVSANNASWSSTFNSTYDSTSADVTANRSNFLSTYNSTYATWAYNMTTPAINYANTNFYNKSSNISWSILDSFPVACPAGSFVSTLGTAVVCTSPSTISGNINMNRNNITNVSYVQYANATSPTAWRSYVNASNSFIIEVSA